VKLGQRPIFSDKVFFRYMLAKLRLNFYLFWLMLKGDFHQEVEEENWYPIEEHGQSKLMHIIQVGIVEAGSTRIDQRTGKITIGSSLF
jgi:hypothetical protein